MNYVINVSYRNAKGRPMHLFRTAPDGMRDTVIEAYKVLKATLPAAYEIEVCRWEESGFDVTDAFEIDRVGLDAALKRGAK